MIRRLSIASCATVLLLLAATPSRAQQDVTFTPHAERGTDLAVLVGAGSTSTHTGPGLAGSAGWQITPVLGIEAQAAWFNRGQGASGFGADIGTLLELGRRSGMTPYVGAGIGLYTATFDSLTSGMSPFYRNRVPGDPGATRVTFTDPAFRIGAGVIFMTRRHLTLRPEASAVFIRGDGSGETMAVIGVRIGYRFEDHPITPERR